MVKNAILICLAGDGVGLFNHLMFRRGQPNSTPSI